MFKLKNYILKAHASMFFSIFTPFIIIASIIMLVKISQVTTIVQLNLMDMLKLYIFGVPELFLYTIPITFFIAGVIIIHKLSNESEIMVLFSLGINPNQILFVIAKVALFLSAILLFTGIIVMPHVNQLYRNFINYKKTNIVFNIKPSKFGQKLGTWLLYIGKKDLRNIYRNVVLYKLNEEGKEVLIMADKAQILNDNLKLKFKLINGKAYLFESKGFTQINFDKLTINDTSIFSKFKYTSSLIYWSDLNESQSKQRRLSNYIMFALFPILSLPLLLSIGVINSRHEKSYTYLNIFISLTIFFTLFLLLRIYFKLWTIPITIIIWSTTSLIIYKKSILKRY